jgi:hypothetical protein
VSHRTAICVVTGKATLVVNSASNYASGPLEPKPLAVSPPRALTSSVRGSTFGSGQTTASVLSSLFPGYHTGSSQTGCDCLAAHGSCPSGLSPAASQYKWKALGRVLTIRLPCLDLRPEHRSVHTSALAYYAFRLLLTGCITASPQTTLPDISSLPCIPVGTHGRLVKPLTAEAITD